jgi:hypothetical protein
LPEHFQEQAEPFPDAGAGGAQPRVTRRSRDRARLQEGLSWIPEHEAPLLFVGRSEQKVDHTVQLPDGERFASDEVRARPPDCLEAIAPRVAPRWR